NADGPSAYCTYSVTVGRAAAVLGPSRSGRSQVVRSLKNPIALACFCARERAHSAKLMRHPGGPISRTGCPRSCSAARDGIHGRADCKRAASVFNAKQESTRTAPSPQFFPGASLSFHRKDQDEVAF